LLRKPRTEPAEVAPSASGSAASNAGLLGCSLALPPARISSTIERSVPISAVPLADGKIAIGIAETKTSAVGWIYDPETADSVKSLSAAPGVGDVTFVTPGEPLMLVDRAVSEFAFARSLSPTLAIGVGPSGVLRRGDDGATGVLWPIPTGLKVTPPRIAALADGYFVAFRQGGAEGQLSTGWMSPTGAALGPLSIIPDAPKSLGTPSVASGEREGILVFAGRTDKTNPFRIYAARARFGQQPSPAVQLALTEQSGGAIAPSLTALANGNFLVQWTDGKVGQYRVHVRLLDASFAPIGDPLLVSAKGTNAGQGTLVAAGKSVVSFFIQTTAGHDELWGASVKCR